MASRNTLEVLAGKANIDPTAYPNDSLLEAAVLNALKGSTASSTATTKLPAAKSVAQVTNV